MPFVNFYIIWPNKFNDMPKFQNICLSALAHAIWHWADFCLCFGTVIVVSFFEIWIRMRNDPTAFAFQFEFRTPLLNFRLCHEFHSKNKFHASSFDFNFFLNFILVIIRQKLFNIQHFCKAQSVKKPSSKCRELFFHVFVLEYCIRGPRARTLVLSSDHQRPLPIGQRTHVAESAREKNYASGSGSKMTVMPSGTGTDNRKSSDSCFGGKV